MLDNKGNKLLDGSMLPTRFAPLIPLGGISIAPLGRMPIAPRGLALALATTLTLATLVACGEKNKPVGQVVAKVNGEEITIHQVKSEFAAAATPSTDEAKLTRTILDSLIDEQLLVEHSKERKLDRDPQVMQAMEKARRRILAQAMQDDLARTLPRPTATEVKAFYVANPALFEKRRIYTFHQFVLERAAFNDALKARLDIAKTNADVVGALKEQDIKFREVVTAKATEQLPMDALPMIAALPKNGLAVLNSGNETVILRLIDFVEQPATMAQATPIIEHFLLNSKKKELLDQRLKTLRTAAAIEYLGPFAQAPATSATDVAPETAAGQAKAAGSAATIAPATAPTAASPAGQVNAQANATGAAPVDDAAPANAAAAANSPAAKKEDYLRKGVLGEKK